MVPDSGLGFSSVVGPVTLVESDPGLGSDPGVGLDSTISRRRPKKSLTIPRIDPLVVGVPSGDMLGVGVTSGEILGVDGPLGDILGVDPSSSVAFDPPISTFSSYAPEFPGGSYNATTIGCMPPLDGLLAFPKPTFLVPFHTSWKV